MHHQGILKLLLSFKSISISFYMIGSWKWKTMLSIVFSVKNLKFKYRREERVN